MSIVGLASADAPSKKRKRLSARSSQEDAEASGGVEKEAKKSLLGGSWSNLDLILSLQDKDISTNRKIELAFNFAISNFSGEGPRREPLQAGRVISFLSDWVQPILISSDTCYDYRLWIVLKFCLEKSAISVSHNLLRPITRAVIHASSFADSGESPMVGEDSSKFYEEFPECVSLLFSLHGRSFNAAGVELWVSCAAAAVGFLLKRKQNGRCSSLSKDEFSASSILLVDQFSSFLRFHPSPKNIFRSFVDRLMEPLVELLALLRAKVGQGENEQGCKLLTVLENSLCNGLCHPSHLSGFASLRNLNAKTDVQKRRNLNESYHRHFFVKFHDIVKEKKMAVMGGLGQLFRIFINSLMNNRGMSSSVKAIHKSDKDKNVPEQEHGSSKVLFEVFIQFMEPLSHDCRKFTEIELSSAGELWETQLMEFYSSVRTVNDILEVVVHEKIYDRTQDSPEGDCCNFLKGMYDVILIICRKIFVLWLSISNVRESESQGVLLLIAKELVVSIGHFLEIEYNVVGDDLKGIWFMMLSYLAISESRGVISDESLLRNEVLRVGSQMINMYSDLRQASRPIFALCEAVRSFSFNDDVPKISESAIFPCGLSPAACKKAVMMLMCSKELRLAISNAIKSIPEGQAGECVYQLLSDFTEALGWLRITLLSSSDKSDINSCAKIFGLISEVYSVVLQSIFVTASNCISVGNSINDLMTAVRLPIETFMQSSSCNFDNFYISFTGKSLSAHVTLVESSWIFLCFFHLFVSCRSLYLQVASLVPPKLSKKAASALGNPFIISSGKEWELEEGCTAEGYFSWIVNPSISLVSMIKTFSECFRAKQVATVCPLVYILSLMALQRLIDLNRQLKSLNYIVQRNKRLVQLRACGDHGQLLQKQNKRLKHSIKVSRQEAAGLANFVTDHLHLLAPEGHSELMEGVKVGRCSEDSRQDAWDLSICSLSERLLPIAIWWLLCRNIDVWCAHASRKTLKTFASLLVNHWVGYFRRCKYTGEQEVTEPFLENVTFHYIAAEVLKDVTFYEQPVLLRHLVLRLSCVLKKLIHPLVSHVFGDDLDLSYPPDWSDCSTDVDKASDSDSARLLWDSVLSDSCYPEISTNQRALPSLKPEFSTCEGLLNLFCKLSEKGIDQSSLAAVVGYILHLERLLVSALVSSNEDRCYLRYDLLKLFVCCRRTLRHLLVSSCKDFDGAEMSSAYDLVVDSLSTVQWLLKSVSGVVALPDSHFGDKSTYQAKTMCFVLIDHTSYLFLTLGEKKRNVYDGLTEQDLSGNVEPWKKLTAVATTLQAEIRTTQGTDVIHWKWNNISCMLSCLQGFVWGLVSALGDFDGKCSIDNTPIFACIVELNKFVNVFEEFLNCYLMLLLVSDDHDENEISLDVGETRSVIHHAVGETNENCAFQHLKLSLLISLLKGENPDVAFSIRKIFMSAAAILKLRRLPFFQKTQKQHDYCNYLQSITTTVLVGSADFMLSNMTEISVASQSHVFVWMDGMLKYLEILGSFFPLGKSVLSNSLYSKMVNMHLRAMGKCISLQGKSATLASHEAVSETNQCGTNMCSMDLQKLEEFKCRLRMSFKELIRKPSRSDFALLVQTLEGVLVGVRQSIHTVHDVNTGELDGGRVSAIVAAGLDLFDLVFDSFSGDRLFGIIKDHAQNLFGSLFNIILLLRGPLIFYEKTFNYGEREVEADPGSTILMCIETLRKFSRKNAQLKMDPCFVGQSLHVPSSLFKHFHQLKSSQASGTSIRFFVDLYAACCRLMCTVVRHQKSETAQCIALLEDSVTSLLNCLESFDDEYARQKGNFVLDIKASVTCASFLRRVYEEIKQQKDTVGAYACHFLSDYLCLSSGLGPRRTGITREVDETLRPGVYALVDTCSPGDFQKLHTILGEGQCRRTLATLRHDHRLYFQYQGKI